MEKKIEQHSTFIKQIIPTLLFIFVFGAIVLWQYRNVANRSIIVAKDAIIRNIDISNDSSVLAGDKMLKALNTEQGLDSLINSIKK